MTQEHKQHTLTEQGKLGKQKHRLRRKTGNQGTYEEGKHHSHQSRRRSDRQHRCGGFIGITLHNVSNDRQRHIIRHTSGTERKNTDQSFV